MGSRSRTSSAAFINECIHLLASNQGCISVSLVLDSKHQPFLPWFPPPPMKWGGIFFFENYMMWWTVNFQITWGGEIYVGGQLNFTRGGGRINAVIFKSIIQKFKSTLNIPKLNFKIFFAICKSIFPNSIKNLYVVKYSLTENSAIWTILCLVFADAKYAIVH